MSRTLESAKEIIAKGIEFGAFEWDDPDAVNDAAVVTQAEGLFEAALSAGKRGSVNDAVLEILFAGMVEPSEIESDVTREAYTQRFGSQPATAAGNGHAAEQPQPAGAFAQPVSAEDASAMAKAAAAPVTEPQPPASSESPADSPAPAAGDDSIEDIFPGYDDQKVADIKKLILDSAASGDLSPEEWERIKAYEAVHEERKTILTLVPQFKAPEPEPTSEEQEQVHAAMDADRAYRAEQASDQTIAQQEQLPIPPQVDGDQPFLPINITEISDGELSALGVKFHSCFARAQWLLSQEEGRHTQAEHLEREAERDAYVNAYSFHRSEIPEGKENVPAQLEAARKQAERDAEGADEVRKLRNQKIRHAAEARELKALAAIYDKAVWRIDKELDRRGRAVITGRAAS